MRIVGGALGGRHFNPKMNKWPTRPTTDQAKEALFNILSNKIDFEEISFLDLFGGTGSISFEMASRGCQNITYVEKYRPCVNFVQLQTKLFNLENNIKIIPKEVLRFISQSNAQYDLIFADPPYSWDKIQSIPEMIFTQHLLNENGLLIIEHDNTVSFDQFPQFEEHRKYGQTIFSFLKNT